eukprot:11911055-Ditylum_brightwellii.AAC.1
MSRPSCKGVLCQLCYRGLEIQKSLATSSGQSTNPEKSHFNTGSERPWHLCLSKNIFFALSPKLHTHNRSSVGFNTSNDISLSHGLN